MDEDPTRITSETLTCMNPCVISFMCTLLFSPSLGSHFSFYFYLFVILCRHLVGCERSDELKGSSLCFIIYLFFLSLESTLLYEKYFINKVGFDYYAK